jgi:hypothetical protein
MRTTNKLDLVQGFDVLEAALRAALADRREETVRQALAQLELLLPLPPVQRRLQETPPAPSVQERLCRALQQQAEDGGGAGQGEEDARTRKR